ncbi:MAG: hypothetical protein MMC33_009114 [Icmadophila ericetorum]|nr:hypothetical protein [Icmadophila ericetorum]
MTGIWSSTAAEADFKTVTGTAGPAAVNTVQAGGAVPGAGGAGGGADGSFGISYQFQTEGLTRYAPMQPKPGSTITATNTAPMFPPSAFSVATTLLPTPSIVTTITQPVDYSASTSIENTGLPAAQPSDDMQKFLNRWKD